MTETAEVQPEQQPEDPPGARSALRVGLACNRKKDHSSDAEAEFDEPETIDAICRALTAGGYAPAVLDAAEDFPAQLRQMRPDIVFNIAEGRTGRNREAQVPAICEYYGVPFTGSDAATLSIALDKSLTKRLAAGCGAAVPGGAVIPKGSEALPQGLRWPVLVKPNAEGSSKGIPDACVAKDAAALAELVRRDMALYGEDLLAEEYIDGREFTVGVLGNGSDLRVFAPMEIVYRRLRGEFKVYSFEVKRNYREYISYQCPPELPDAVLARMTRDAAAVYRGLGCLDFARVDFRLAPDGTPYFIEANPLPGLAPGYSDFPMLAGFCGMGYDELVCRVLESALRRYGMEAARHD